MKCNKCGTPIIPGENTCRICGNKADFSERANEPEVIDFPEDDIIEENDSMELPDLDQIINFNNEIPNIDVVSEPIEPEVIDVPLEPEIIEPEVVEPEIIEEVQEPVAVKPDKKKVLEKAVVKEEKPKKIKEPKTDKKGSVSSNVGVILLTLILLCSLAGNVYLFIMNSNSKASEKKEPTEEKVNYSKVAYNNYKITIPNTWTSEKRDKNLLIYDDTQNWSASIQTIDNASYDAFVTNKDKLVESLGALKYQFTSNYSKEVEKKDYYLFKGKYYNYSVYVIVTEINDKKMLFTDLKFKGEVDDLLLNDILKVMGTIKDNETTELFKDNFEFSDISNQISVISQNKE